MVAAARTVGGGEEPDREEQVARVRPPRPPPWRHDGQGEGGLVAPHAVAARRAHPERVPPRAEVGERGLALRADVAPGGVEAVEADGVALRVRRAEVEGGEREGHDAVVVAEPELVRHRQGAAERRRLGGDRDGHA